MSFRWFLIIAICVWLIYEYTNQMWINKWYFDYKYVKIGVAIVIIMLLLFAPSLDNILLQQNINSYLHKILVDEAHQQVYESSKDQIDIHALYQMQSGAHIAKNKA